MTPDILPLLAASFACVSVLVLFARHNKRTGWVKPRRLSLEDMLALESDWKLYAAPVRSEAAAHRPASLVKRPSPSELTAFTLQLANIQQSLAAATLKPVDDRERVRV